MIFVFNYDISTPGGIEPLDGESKEGIGTSGGRGEEGEWGVVNEDLLGECVQ